MDCTPLHLSAQNGCDRAARMLIKLGANIKAETQVNNKFKMVTISSLKP